MRILTWNIKHGGSKKQLENIILNLIDHDPDLIVLTDYRAENGRIISNGLHKADGYISLAQT